MMLIVKKVSVIIWMENVDVVWVFCKNVVMMWIVLLSRVMFVIIEVCVIIVLDKILCINKSMIMIRLFIINFM